MKFIEKLLKSKVFKLSLVSILLGVAATEFGKANPSFAMKNSADVNKEDELESTCENTINPENLVNKNANTNINMKKLVEDVDKYIESFAGKAVLLQELKKQNGISDVQYNKLVGQIEKNLNDMSEKTYDILKNMNCSEISTSNDEVGASSIKNILSFMKEYESKSEEN